MKNKYLIISILIFSTVACSKTLDCEKFKDGTYFLPSHNNADEYYYVFRKNNRQVEVDSRENEVSFFLKWHNNCSYTVVLADPLKDKFDIRFNLKRPDSIRIEFIKTIKDTVYYNSKAYLDKKIYELLGGKMIRIGEVPPIYKE